jgi:hypothetical protein
MALNKDVLGMELYNSRHIFDNMTHEEIIQQYGTIEEARLAACKGDAEAIINHIKTAGVVSVNVITTGTATNHTGTGTGTIS